MMTKATVIAPRIAPVSCLLSSVSDLGGGTVVVVGLNVGVRLDDVESNSGVGVAVVGF